MEVDLGAIISVTDVNQNFSKVMRLIEKNGQALIFKNNKPRYLMLDINNSETIDKAIRQMKEFKKELKAGEGAKVKK